jgi:glucose/arabinose dehydrogenase
MAPFLPRISYALRLSHSLLLVAGCLLLLTSCGGNDDASSETPPPSQGADSPTTAPGSSPTQPPAAAPQTGLPARVNLDPAFDLVFARMTGAYQAPDMRWYVTEQRGRVYVFDNRRDAQPQLLLDITNRVNTSGSEEGLLGFAFAPDFATSGSFYVYYSAANPRRSVISRFTASAGSAAVSSSETVLLEISQPFSNHNGGQIAFGPDGDLYIGLGDGGGNSGPNSQDLSTLLGKLLRIDVAAGGAYRVPVDNPFVNQPGTRGEIWAWGLRNPWRYSWDSATGDLWLADVGQNRREEVNIITKGSNYGWNLMEGSECFGGGNGCNQTGLTPPLLEYQTGANCSISGGFVYRGSAIPELRGAYVYGDYCSGRVWALRYDGARVTEQRELAVAGFRISSFAQDRSGELYVLDHTESGGGIYKLIP